MSHASYLTLAQDGISVAPGAPAGPAAPAAPGVPGAPVPPQAGAPAQRSSGGFDGMTFIFIAVFGLMIFMMWSGSRREKKKQEEIMTSLKKGAKVTTVGGLVATVVEVRDNEVVLESSGNRLTFVKTAVQSVASEEPAKA